MLASAHIVIPDERLCNRRGWCILKTVYTARSAAAQHAATSGVQTKEEGKFNLFSNHNRSLYSKSSKASGGEIMK